MTVAIPIIRMALPLWESVGMRPGFDPHFQHLCDLLAPKFWPCLPFYSDLVVPISNASHFQHADDLCAPQIDQIYHFLQILLSPILNLKRRTPTDHYDDVIMGAMASQITSLTIVYSTVYSGTDQRKHQSSASLAIVGGIHRGPVNSPHKWPVTRKMFPFDDVIMFLPGVPPRDPDCRSSDDTIRYDTTEHHCD